MKKLCVLFGVLAISSPTLALNVHIDVLDNRDSGMQEWHEVVFHEDHRSRQPTQPPRTWTNLTFAIPYWAHRVQLTALDHDNSIQNNDGARSAEIPHFAVNQVRRSMNVSFVWWGLPWSVYLGYGR